MQNGRSVRRATTHIRRGTRFLTTKFSFITAKFSRNFRTKWKNDYTQTRTERIKYGKKGHTGFNFESEKDRKN